ncbi:MAG: HpcH/HpaI aldolase family protein [Blastocatellia bacterium]
MRTNTTRAKLKAGGTVYGCFVRYPEATLAEMLGYYGWDYLLLDGEHSTITPRDCENLVRACELRDITPIVRVSTNQPQIILQYLDTGVQGAQVPMINTAAEAEACVRAVKYMPRGGRGLAGVRAANFGQVQPFSFKEYTARANQETMVIAQVETVQAVEALPEILATPDVDVIFLGPTDLSQSLGHPGDFNHPLVQETFTRVIDQVNASDKVLGTLVSNLEGAQKWRDRGARYMMITMEALLGPACRSFLAEARKGE